jgi:prolyl-tRNA synthetase
MRYLDLKIETLRQAPSNARTDGFAFLVRAGYITREGLPTLLGRRALSRLENLAKENPDFFAQLGLIVVQAESREIFFELPTGRLEILHCQACHYAARREIARFKKPVLPAEAALPAEKVRTPECNTIDSLASYLGVPKEKTAKALMYTRLSDGQFVFAVVRGDMQLSETKLKKLVGELRPATTEEIAKSGAAAGYASPIGLRNALIVVDDLIPNSANLVAGANEPGYHFKNTNYGRNYQAEFVADLVIARGGDPCPNCGAGLLTTQAELVADADGLCFENILTVLAEVYHDDKGLSLPAPAAPFQVYLMQLPGKETDTRVLATELYAMLETAGIPVLFDDRAERAGVKFNDADLIGCPLRVTVGEKNLKEGMVELKPRRGTENQLLPRAELLQTIQSLLKTYK